MRVPSVLLAIVTYGALVPGSVSGDDGLTLDRVVATRCFGCHDQTNHAGGLNLESLVAAGLPNDASDSASFRTWVRVHDRVRELEMPPNERLAQPERTTVLNSLHETLVAAEVRTRKEIGRSTLRRLTRTEYENTLRDLLGLPALDVRDPSGTPSHRAVAWRSQAFSLQPRQEQAWTVSSADPVESEGVDDFAAIALDRSAAIGSFGEGMISAYQAALCSPDFLFLRESVGGLDDYALASRLWYFLWCSTPDAELTSIREILERRRADPTCAECHRHIDPPGFALESYDAIGGFRTRVRALEQGDRVTRPPALAGRHEFLLGLPVDASGQLADGRSFGDIGEYRRLLLQDERQIARNFVNQLIVYATGTPVSFADRDVVERILDETADKQYGLRSLVHGVIQSEVFRRK